MGRRRDVSVVGPPARVWENAGWEGGGRPSRDRNYACALEQLGAAFHTQVVAAPAFASIVAANEQRSPVDLRDHAVAHREFFETALGSSRLPDLSVDFSSVNFGDRRSVPSTAQRFEDTGVRAYRGQAPALLPYDAGLEAALTIHSVEARHAAAVRRLRGNFTDVEPCCPGWVDQNLTDVPGAQAVYAGAENVVHAGVNVDAISPAAFDEDTEAFDEPLTQAQVLAIVDPFIV